MMLYRSALRANHTTEWGGGLNRFLTFSDPYSTNYEHENLKITVDLNNEPFSDSSIAGFAGGLIADITVGVCVCVPFKYHKL